MDVRPTTPTLEVLSVSPRFGSPDGHHTPHQLTLGHAARSNDVRWVVVGPAHASEAPSEPVDLEVIPAIRGRRAWELAETVDAVLRDRPRTSDRRAVVLYEGGTDKIGAFAALARAHPDTSFVVNLFHHERPVDFLRGPDPTVMGLGSIEPVVDGSLARSKAALTAIDVPPNLAITAETPHRALAARRLGVPVRDVWPLHSQITDLPWAPPVRENHSGPRVLVPLAGWQVDSHVASELRRIIGRVHALTEGRTRPQWVIAGLYGIDDRWRRRLRALESLDARVEVDAMPVDRDAYADRFRATDVVWLPGLDPYVASSSGKALDALVSGRPVIAPATTFGAREMERWVPGSPSYRDAWQAVRIFTALADLAPVLDAGLASRMEEIRATYSPARAIRFLLGTVPPGETSRVEGPGPVGVAALPSPPLESTAPGRGRLDRWTRRRRARWGAAVRALGFRSRRVRAAWRGRPGRR